MANFLEAMSFGESLTSSLVGIMIVFIGLICLIALVTVMGAVCQKLLKDEKSAKTVQKKVTAPAAPRAAKVGAIENRDELVAIFSAAVAEELGTDVSAIRVVSLKEIG